jgi:hypothetical protein
MHTLDNITQTTWVLCHDSVEVFHIIKLEAGNKLDTGQPYLEQFDTEDQLEQRIIELTGNPNWYTDYKSNLY